MRAYDMAVSDCDEIINDIKAMKEEEIEGDRNYWMKLTARAYVKRAAAQVWLSNFDKSIEDFNSVLKNDEFCQILGEKDVAMLHKDKARVQMRMKSNDLKADGDRFFYHEKQNDALAKYHEALKEDDENEYALANIGVLHMKKLDYDQSIDYASRALNIVTNF
jgi:tetratricopeptide (TPR) repeat protein